MLDAIIWYLIVFAAGWTAFPILYRLLPVLPDRGFSFARIFGLLVWGYIFWISGRLGFTENNLGGILFCAVILVGTALWSLRDGLLPEIIVWIKENLKLVVIVELLFITAFSTWTVIRALNPDILGTEKPMELAFINAILQSDTFPPHDPWLSGYAISYYYFGYILVAMLAKLGGTLGSVAFNLSVSLIFGLSALGAYGLVYNLLRLKKDPQVSNPELKALLGPLFTLVLSNWEGALHFFHSRGWWWRTGIDGQVAGFWRWLDIQDLTSDPASNTFGHWWWWRASRVIKDYDFSGFGFPAGKEVISEFPFFSYLLGDLHPHVLSMPFVFLVLGIGLALFLGAGENRPQCHTIFNLNISPQFLFLTALVSGSMVFLNTWNFPIYVGVIAGLYALRNRFSAPRPSFWKTILDLILYGVAVGLVGAVLYLPFFIGFDSQAGGVIPNLLYITRGNQFWVMFGPLLVPILIYLLFRIWSKDTDVNWRFGLTAALGLIIGLFIFLHLMILLLSLLPINLGALSIGDSSTLQIYLGSIAALDLGDAVFEGFLRRLSSPGTWLTVGTLSLITLGFLFKGNDNPAGKRESDPSDAFVQVLIFSGILLVLIPEFVFLRDLFGYRINTIFKFYYQTWLMWSAAAAYGLVVIFQAKNTPLRWVLRITAVTAVFLGLFYPVLSLPSKTNNFQRQDGLTLDGGAFFRSYYPDDAAAADWLREQPYGVIAEAVGGSYSTEHARISTYSGFPTVLGWDFHEVQWRGGSELVNPRKEDIRELYCTHNWQTAKTILDQYRVNYLVVGNVERSTYLSGTDVCPNGLVVDKFNQNLTPLFQNSSLVIYGYQSDQERGWK